MVFDRNIELKEKQEKLLAELRKIVGRGFEYSNAYLKQCDFECNRIGEQETRYSKITKKYVYIGCRVIYTTNDEGTEYGARIRKYSVYTTQGNTNKIALEDLYVKDLEKILYDIKFALWWEKSVRMKKLAAEMADCQKYVDAFNKFCLK
jgi:hypothetical protein